MKATFSDRYLRTKIALLLLIFILSAMPAVSGALTSATTPSQVHTINAFVEGGSVGRRANLLPFDKADTSSIHEQAVLSNEIAGPGAIFGKMLTTLSRKSDTSGNEVRQLFAGIQLLFPDLYRIFLTL